MKTKEEILDSYNTTGSDGLPEISAGDLLNAMEAYKQQWAEAAFEAARKQKNGVYEFESFSDFVESEKPSVPSVEDNFGITLAAVADSIVTNFLPDDASVNEFSFDFNLEGKGYTAFYEKDAEGYWKMGSWKGR
ncbi:hypothetical protein AAFN85_04765 [Mucilaginibacter sp. CAU 1740]|uniref:hypothetical protein n=1 Tax=Mucilaginibacter sp. CAU 1740 TaxID=3140365 RepID=UPI00325B8B5B